MTKDDKMMGGSLACVPLANKRSDTTALGFDLPNVLSTDDPTRSDTHTADNSAGEDDDLGPQPSVGENPSRSDSILEDVEEDGDASASELSCEILGKVEALVHADGVITTANDEAHEACLMCAVQAERRSSGECSLSPRLSRHSSSGAEGLPPDALVNHPQVTNCCIGAEPVQIGERAPLVLQSAGPGFASDVPMPDRRNGMLGETLLSGPSPTKTGAGSSKETHGIVYRSQYRGVSFDKKKRKWRVQIKVAALGKSGVSVGYFDTEDAAAHAYDRAAIGLLGAENCRSILNFPLCEYDTASIPKLVGKTREEVKALLKSERAKLPRRRLSNRRRTSKYLGVGSSNRKNQWQARILYHGKVTHLGYYPNEEQAARIYDRVSISLHKANAETNFPLNDYKKEIDKGEFAGMSREDLQRALGVKPMDKSSKYRGVSKKKGKWEAKVMLNRKWAYRELFDTEIEAARAYDTAVWGLKPKEAKSYVNFKESCPPEVEAYLKSVANGDSRRSSSPNPLAGATAHPEVLGAAGVNLTTVKRHAANSRSLLNPGWLKVPGQQEVLQRFNSAPNPQAFPQRPLASNGVPVSTNSHSGILKTGILGGARNPDLIRVHSIPNHRKSSILQSQSLPFQTVEHLHNAGEDQGSHPSVHCQMVDQDSLAEQHGTLQRRHFYKNGNRGVETVCTDHQDFGIAATNRKLAPVSDVEPPDLSTALIPENAVAPFLVRLEPEAHVIQRVHSQEVRQRQRCGSDGGVYLMVHQTDQVKDMDAEHHRIASLQTLASFPNQGVVPVHVSTHFEPSPFAEAANCDLEDSKPIKALEADGWNLERVVSGEPQNPSQYSLPLMNLEQVLQSTNQGAVAIDLTGSADRCMEGLVEAEPVKADPMLLTLGADNVGQDIVMADMGECQDPINSQQDVIQHLPQLQVGQVARIEDLVAMVEPEEPPFKQVFFGDELEVDKLLLKPRSELVGCYPLKTPMAFGSGPYYSGRPICMTDDEVMDVLTEVGDVGLRR